MNETRLRFLLCFGQGELLLQQQPPGMLALCESPSGAPCAWVASGKEPVLKTSWTLIPARDLSVLQEVGHHHVGERWVGGALLQHGCCCDQLAKRRTKKRSRREWSCLGQGWWSPFSTSKMALWQVSSSNRALQRPSYPQLPKCAEQKAASASPDHLPSQRWPMKKEQPSRRATAENWGAKSKA